MKICVCVKGVPDSSEAEIAVDKTGKNIRITDSTILINDFDSYALEEAILIKEATQGSLQVLSAGSDNDDVTMIAMEAIAKGSDGATLVIDPRYDEIKNDPIMVAKMISSALKDQSFDLIITGCMASDDGFTSLGSALAAQLGIAHATMVRKTELTDNNMRVHRELEGGLNEVVDISLPAVLTIQTGINKPRYASVLAIKKARKKERNVVTFEEVGFDLSDGDNEMKTELQRFWIPEIISNAEFIEGDARSQAETLAKRLIEGGIL